MSRCFNKECPNIVRVAGKMHIGCMHCFAAREPIMRQLDPHGSPKLQVFMRQLAASSGFLDFQVGLRACMYACAKGHVRRCGCYTACVVHLGDLLKTRLSPLSSIDADTCSMHRRSCLIDLVVRAWGIHGEVLVVGAA